MAVLEKLTLPTFGMQSVLPPSNIPGRLPPYALDRERVFVEPARKAKK